uniref:Zinc finger C-x8-C-x5-C-x3-H type family protein n=1 Tax=Populus tomentosa TaxID=118781 RepID=A0A385JI13_POPTO|nr:Zinc finger C-x8-C-x5-C-x3-H type family protein [Populus tomentosa]
MEYHKYDPNARASRKSKDRTIATTAMTPPSSYFHYTKYAKHSSPTPSPRYPNNLNFHHHSNFLEPPPPPQTPPPPPSFPQFSSRNPHFSYNPSPNHPQIHDNYNHQRSHHDLPHSTQLPWVSHQLYDDRQPPRRLPEFDHCVHEPRPDFTFLRDDHMQTRHELEGDPNPNSRLVQDRNVVTDGESEHRRRRGEFGSNSDRSSSSVFRTVSNQLRGFKSNSGNYENRRRLNYDYHEKGSANQRWVHDREVMGESRDSLIELGSNEIGDGENRILAGKREHYRIRDGNLELERNGGKRSREGSYEFNRTPRKQLQKKSALLRLQKPSYRNREDKRVHYSSYADYTKSSPFRGKHQESGFLRGKDKDKVLHADRGMVEGARERSPVELDVSFKSNSLVAKAILTPTLSSAGASEMNLTPRNRKVRKVLVPAKDMDSLNSSMHKLNKVALGLDEAASVANKTSSSNKELKKSKEVVTASGITNVRDSSSLPMKRTVSLGSGTNLVSGKTSSLKGGKKKKVVKRVVKKVVNHKSTLSSSQPTKTCDEPVKADSFAYNPTEPIDPDKAATVADIVDPQPCPNEATAMPKNDKVERFDKFMESGLVGAGADSGNLFVFNINGNKSRSASPSGFSNHEETKFGESFINGDCDKGLHAIADTENSLKKSLDETFRSDIGGVEDVSKQPCQNGDSCLFEDNAVSGSLKVLDYMEGNTDFGSLSSEKTIIHEGPMNTCMPLMGLDTASMNSQERITVFDAGASDVGCKEPCRNLGSPSAENGITDLLQGASFPVVNNRSFSVSISGETGIQNDVIRPNQGVGAILVSPSCCTNSEEINISVHGTGDDFSEQLSQDGVTKTLESASIGGSLDTKVSAGGSDEDATDITKNDKKIEVPQLDLSRTDVSYMHLDPANMVTSTTAHWVDKTLRLCFEDSATAECTFSGSQFVDVGSQSCNIVSVLHEGSLTDVSAGRDSVRRSDDVGPSNVSPRNEKNRKFSAPQLELNSPQESDADEGTVFAEEEAVVSDMDFLCTSDFLPAQKRITASLENCSAGEHTVAAVKDAFEDDGQKDVKSHFAVEELAVTKVTSRDLVVLGGKDIINATPVVVGSSNPNDSMDVDAGEGDKMDINAAEEQVVIDGGIDPCQIPSKLQTQVLTEKLPRIDVEDSDFHGVKNNSPCMSNNLSSFEDGFGVSTINSSEELMAFVPETLSDRGFPETLPDVLGTSLSKNPVEKVHGYHDKILAERPAINVGSNSSICTTSSQSGKIVLKSDHAVEGDRLLARRTGHFPSQDSKITTRTQNAVSGQLYGRKNQTNCAVSEIYPGRSSFVFTASKSTASSSRNSKTQTWHRTDSSSDSAPPAKKAFSSTVHAQMQFPRKTDKLQSTSYIRKGNSLVRKPISVAQSPDPHGLSSSVYQLNSSGTNEPKKSTGSDSRIDIVDPLDVVRKGGMNASCERPKTPPLSSVPKIPNQATNALGVRVSSPLAEHLHSLSTETATASAEFMESNDVPKSSDNLLKISESPITQNSQINNLECNGDLNEDNKVVLANVKNLTYVKRKSNQLVATSNPCASSVQNACNTSSSDSYYKRRRNQLIRTSLESQVKQTTSIPDESLNSEGQTALYSFFSGNFSKRRLRKGERIFRVGLVRYKMDSSKRTLQRISGDESSCSGALQKEKDAKKSYVPRRLMIGKDEYVRIGNGNQLIRDPKKRTRILASEKVRWSLHTARSRLARKRKYCQFFSRFGKCNKDDGKCPFIHDSSKIAVCTKFLNGLCFNPECKLTHKVIPERMPDCSYFLQGLCTNKDCPYRHVRVNPNASICEGFLRGYCADVNECLKKHSYVCPTYEATGSCPQGSKCKLHHPKNRSKEKKSKRSRDNNAQGRYFGLMHASTTELRNPVPGKLNVLDNDAISFKGSIADYISLDVIDEVVENTIPADEHTALGDSDPLELQLGDLDELIKPVRIMNI